MLSALVFSGWSFMVYLRYQSPLLLNAYPWQPECNVNFNTSSTEQNGAWTCFLCLSHKELKIGVPCFLGSCKFSCWTNIKHFYQAMCKVVAKSSEDVKQSIRRARQKVLSNKSFIWLNFYAAKFKAIISNFLLIGN